MRHYIAATLLVCASTVPANANDVIDNILDGHISPIYAALSTTTATLAEVAAADCTPVAIQPAYHAAFDAWIAASHLRFGPSEVDDRAFALAFWPDSRGATPKTLRTLIADEDPIAADVRSYADMSIAARGFYAMEFLLFDANFSALGSDAYRCQLIRTMAEDIASVSNTIHTDWKDGFAQTMRAPAEDGTYRTDAEVLQEFYKAFTTGLQFTSDARLGRPLGTFDKPRPTRAEAWRSERSARNVAVSLRSLRDMGDRLSEGDPLLLTAFDSAIARVEALEHPIATGVTTPRTRIRIEVLQQAVDSIRTEAAQNLGPSLGVTAGFNSLDGD